MPRLILILFILLGGALIVPAQTNPSSGVGRAADDDELFIKAVKSGDLGAVTKLIDKGVSPETKDDGSPALCIAVRFNHADIAELLLARGAKVDQEEDDEGTALQIAAAAGHANLVKLLITHGADVRRHDHDGHDSLLCAAFGSMLRTAPDSVVKAFFAIDEDDEDKTEIFQMIGNEHVAAAKLLLEAGADVNTKGGDCGLTPLMAAAMGGNVEMARLLLEHRADTSITEDELTALQFAELFDSPDELTKELSRMTNEKDKQALLNWVQFTASGRHTVIDMLRKAPAVSR